MLYLIAGLPCSKKNKVANFIETMFGIERVLPISNRYYETSLANKKEVSVAKENFSLMLVSEQIIEHEEFDGSFFGTTKQCIDKFVNGNERGVKVISSRGAKKIKEIYGDKVTVIYLYNSDVQSWVIEAKDRYGNSVNVSSYYDEMKIKEEFDFNFATDNLSQVFFEVKPIFTKTLEKV